MTAGRPIPPCHSEPVPSPAERGEGRSEESAYRFSLDGAWIEIFRAGDYAERGRWTEAQLDQLAADYDPRRHAAPVVLGHPADDAPAYAWVRRLRRAGQSLWAQLEKVDPLFEALLRAGRFAQRSVALYTSFPATRGPYLRHVGFLGAAPPAVKGLAPVRFADAACPARFPVGASVTFAFDTALHTNLLSPAAPLSRAESRDAAGTSEAPMPESKWKLDTFLDHLRAFFTPSQHEGFASAPSSGDESATAGSSSAFAERLTALEQRLEALTGSSLEPVTPSDPERSRGGVEGSLLAHQQITTFIDSLRSHGRFPPAFERWGVREFMDRLAAAETPAAAADPSTPLRTSKNVCPTTAQEEDVILPPLSEAEGSEACLPATAGLRRQAKDRDQEAPLTPLLAWFQDFLTKLPAVIEFRELGGESAHGSRIAGHGSRLVRFTEPHRGMSIDPASVELAERAEALAVELGISYAEALARLREEHRRNLTTA